jgi:hypothetical protein
MAQKLQKLLIWHKANELWEAINAMLERPGFQRDWKLHDQTADAIDSVVANIPEGYEQPTDRAFARIFIRPRAPPLKRLHVWGLRSNASTLNGSTRNRPPRWPKS